MVCSEGGDATEGEKYLSAGEHGSEISARAPVTDTAETTEDEAPAAARSSVVRRVGGSTTGAGAGRPGGDCGAQQGGGVQIPLRLVQGPHRAAMADLSRRRPPARRYATVTPASERSVAALSLPHRSAQRLLRPGCAVLLPFTRSNSSVNLVSSRLRATGFNVAYCCLRRVFTSSHTDLEASMRWYGVCGSS